MPIWTRRLPLTLERPTANLPQTADVALFRITGGKIRVLSLIGEVTTVIQTQANNTKLKHNPVGVGSDVDLCAVLDITADAVGTYYSIVGVLATAMKSTSLWLVVPADNIAAAGLILGPGDIELDCAASNTGQVKWTLVYELMEAGANVAVVTA
jgi:hypothetical protein